MDIEVAQRYNMRWTRETCPFPIPEFKKAVITHPIIESYDELPEDQKTIISNTKNVIVSYIGECRMQLFGSRIKGYWTEDSDYDIVIYKVPNTETIDLLKKYGYEHGIDLCFTDRDQHITDKTIEIVHLFYT